MNDAKATLTFLSVHAPLVLPLLEAEGYYESALGTHAPAFDWVLEDDTEDGIAITRFYHNDVEGGEFDCEATLRTLNIPYQRTNEESMPSRDPMSVSAGTEQYLIDHTHAPLHLMDYGHRPPIEHHLLVAKLTEGAEQARTLVDELHRGVATSMPWAHQWALITHITGGEQWTKGDFTFTPLLVNLPAITNHATTPDDLVAYIDDHILHFGGLPVEIAVEDDEGEETVLNWDQFLSLFSPQQRQHWAARIDEHDRGDTHENG
jgi:hypothetical protein